MGAGNVYLTGVFQGSSIAFGSYTLVNTLVTYYDAFVVKYDTNGNVLWARSFGGGVNDGGYGISTDKNGNVFVIGSFSSNTIAFDTTTFQTKP